MRTQGVAVAAVAALTCAAGGAFAALIPVSSYSYQWGPSGSYPDSGGELTDGQWSVGGIQPVGPWVGFDGNPMWAVFDLGSTQSVRAAEIVYCQWGNAAVYLPTTVSFEVSDTADFTNATPVVFTTPLEEVHGGVTVSLTYALGEQSGRYIRVKADHDRQWLFVGEVMFDSVPAPGAAVLLGIAGVAAGRRRR